MKNLCKRISQTTNLNDKQVFQWSCGDSTQFSESLDKCVQVHTVRSQIPNIFGSLTSGIGHFETSSSVASVAWTWIPCLVPRACDPFHYVVFLSYSCCCHPCFHYLHVHPCLGHHLHFPTCEKKKKKINQSTNLLWQEDLNTKLLRWKYIFSTP